MLHAKKLVHGVLANSGYRLIKIDPPYKPTSEDMRNREDLLAAIVPVVEPNAQTGEWPTPDFLRDYFNGRRLAMVRLVLEECDKAGVKMAGRSIIDIGCHAGALMLLAEKRYPDARIVGCDIHETTLKMAERAVPSAEVFFAGFADIPADRTFGAAFFMQVLEHLVDPHAAVRRLLDVVEDDGTLVLTVPDGREDRFPAKEYDPEFDSYSGHVNFWSPEGWHHFLARVAPECRLHTAKLATGQLFAALTKGTQSH